MAIEQPNATAPLSSSNAEKFRQDLTWWLQLLESTLQSRGVKLKDVDPKLWELRNQYVHRTVISQDLLQHLRSVTGLEPTFPSWDEFVRQAEGDRYEELMLALKEANTQLVSYATQAIDLESDLENFRIAIGGKKGPLAAAVSQMGGIKPDDRKVVGPVANGIKHSLNEAISARKNELELATLEATLEAEREDLSLPPRFEPVGALHPVMQVFEELAAIFADMGFAVAEGPDIEDDFHNFTALNFPAGHPAREMHDTFFMKPAADGSRKLLRTHTSPIQVRAMLNSKPPIRVIAPGRVYRKDWDATHTPMFHQIEGLVVDETVHMGHLKACLTEAFSRFFEVPTTQSRFRPHFFPFTEPSAEMDIRCDRSGGEIKIGQGDDWLEILGCGMIHPNVLRACNIDPEKYQGFAFGLGVDRLAMLKYGMPDLRPYFEADVEWIKHYGFKPWLLPTVTGGLS
jgi:phenylalanyl-tRNA synthetase alpha chain